ncbi:MAG: tetratricopeptide repeat protein [Planctomycetota bacterium]|nr:tetratricopeptide repeat protein [Planctomycetota bacterium]
MSSVSQASACCRSPWRWIGVGSLVVVVALIAWLRPDAIDPVVERRDGVAHAQAGRTAEAIGCFERALVASDDATTRLMLADALKSVGRFDAASREYKKALTLEPKNAIAWFNFGNLLHTHFHDARGALEAYRKASEADPTMGVAQFSLGLMLIETHDFETAVLTLQSALQIGNPTAAWRADAQTALDLARIRNLEAQGKLKPPRQ